MGDVVHAIPVLSDIRKNFPEANIDWLVEESFADIPRSSPIVSEVISCAVRRWRKHIFSKTTWAQIGELKGTLESKKYDVVVDLQGLIKSAILASWTGQDVSGYDKDSIKEPLASSWYDNKYAVSKKESAVNRCRELAAKALGYNLEGDAEFLFKQERNKIEDKKILFFCNTSRKTKLWPEEDWVELGNKLNSLGYLIDFSWSSEEEYNRVKTISKAIRDGCQVLEKMSIGKLMDLIGTCRAVVGVDTGLTHLSSAMGKPTVGIFRDYPINLVPLVGKGKKVSLGGPGTCPSVEDVFSAFEEVLK